MSIPAILVHLSFYLVVLPRDSLPSTPILSRFFCRLLPSGIGYFLPDFAGDDEGGGNVSSSLNTVINNN